jgi:hypothetical protein
MKTIFATFLGMSLLAGLADQAAAASTKQRGYKAKSPCYGGACAPAPSAAPRRPSRGYLPRRRGGSEYDFPRFGSKRWWQLQEDRD